MQGLTLAVGSAVGYVSGVVAHEFTHWATARLLGREAHIDWFSMDTRFDVEGIDRWKHRAILMAPQAIGGAAAAGTLLSAIDVSIEMLPLLLAWIAYTVMGGSADWSLRVSRGEPARDVLADQLGMSELAADHQRQIFLTFAGFTLIAASHLITMVAMGTGLEKVGHYLIGLPVLAIGIGLMLVGPMSGDPRAF